MTKFKVGDRVTFKNSGYSFDGEEGVITDVYTFYYNVQRLNFPREKGWVVEISGVTMSKKQTVLDIINDL